MSSGSLPPVDLFSSSETSDALSPLAVPRPSMMGDHGGQLLFYIGGKAMLNRKNVSSEGVLYI